MDDFYVCTRAVKKNAFDDEPGATKFLRVPPVAAQALPGHAVAKGKWLADLRKQAVWGVNARTGGQRGDVLLYVHGYNNSLVNVLTRQRRLAQDLAAIGWKGCVVSFDWPSDDTAVAYLADRHDAKKTAMRLVTDLIGALAERQQPNCTINIHVIAHSMGALVVREAFDDADDAKLASNAWMVSQMCLIGGDISADSLEDGDSDSDSLYRHCIRLTNYHSNLDSVLKLSNAKRAGLAPRVGRVGLPARAPRHAVNVDCSEYHATLLASAIVQASDQPGGFSGNKEHSWYIGNLKFTRDLFETLRGDLDRHVIPTRRQYSDGRLVLV
ncbi:MAG TPA: alpha/beta hydrolase [Tahibacter sp.]|nr:alpha/beta hydrolase [Tahibacter sp.]